jgi:hypothetical protein
MALVLRAPGRKISLPDRLAELGRGRRRAGVAAGAFRLLAGSLGLLTLLTFADAALHLPAVARSFGLVAWVAVTLALYLRGVRPAARLSTRPLAVAQALETRFPKFNDALATAVDLLTDGRGGNRFRDVTVLRAENLVRRVPLETLVPSGRAWRGFWLAALALTVATPLALYDAGRAGLALQRVFDPLGHHPWPTKTRLTLLEPTGPASLLTRGDAFGLRFTVGGVLPETATVVVRLSGDEPGEEAVPLTLGEGETTVTIDHRIDAGRVPRDFQVRVKAGDAETPWHAVEVAAGPKLVALNGRASPQIDLTYPAYTDLMPATLADGAGVVEATAGTQVHFVAAADRPIARAAFVPQFDTLPVQRAAAVASLSSANPLAALGAQLLAGGLSADIPVNASGGDFTRLEARFTPHLPGLYALRFEDARGLVGTRLIDFRCLPDPSPVVLIERPLPATDSLQLLPTASFTLRGHAEDRPFAVRSIACEYRTKPDGAWETVTLTDLAALAAPLPAMTGGALGVAKPKPFALDAGRRVALASFRKPDGSELTDGDTLTLRLAARDWDDRTALKEPGRSKEVEVRILSRPSLETALAKALADLRPEALRLEAKQRDVNAKTDDLTRAAELGPLSKEDAAKLAAAEADQRQLRAKVADAETGLRARVDQLRRTAEANALTRSPSADKIAAVAGELTKLADQSLERAEAGLAAAKQAVERPGKPDPKEVAAGLKQAAASQPAAEESLKAILERLEQWGGAGEVRGAAQDLKNEVARAGEQAAKAAQQVGPAKPPEELTAAEKSAVNGAAEKLAAAADRAGDLLAKAARIAAEKEAAAAKAGADTPAGKQAQAEADALRDAVKAAGGADLPGDLRQSAADTRAQKPNAAAGSRQSAQDRLDKLADALTEKPPEAGDALAKKRQQAVAEIDKLAVEQDELRKKAKAVAAQPDGPGKDKAVQELAAEQDRLRKKAEQALERLTRDPINDDPAAPAEKAAESLRKAAEAMRDARDDLDRGRVPTGKQDQALDKLDETLDKLERTEKRDGQQLAREERERVAEQLKVLRDKQKAAAAEADRIDAAVAKAEGWDRPLQRSLRDLGDRETELAAEVAAFGEKVFGEKLPVFAKLAAQSAAAMRQAAERITARGEGVADLAPDAAFDPVAEKLAAKRVNRPVQLALRRLDQILDAVQPEKPGDKPKPDEQLAQPPMPPMPPMEGEPPAGPKPDTLPALAQLKALRAMQLDVKARTAAFAEENPDSTKLTPDAVTELREIEQSQREVAELFDALAEQMRKQATPADPDEKE